MGTRRFLTEGTRGCLGASLPLPPRSQKHLRPSPSCDNQKKVPRHCCVSCEAERPLAENHGSVLTAGTSAQPACCRGPRAGSSTCESCLKPEVTHSRDTCSRSGPAGKSLLQQTSASPKGHHPSFHHVPAAHPASAPLKVWGDFWPRSETAGQDGWGGHCSQGSALRSRCQSTPCVRGLQLHCPLPQPCALGDPESSCMTW